MFVITLNWIFVLRSNLYITNIIIGLWNSWWPLGPYTNFWSIEDINKKKVCVHGAHLVRNVDKKTAVRSADYALRCPMERLGNLQRACQQTSVSDIHWSVLICSSKTALKFVLLNQLSLFDLQDLSYILQLPFIHDLVSTETSIYEVEIALHILNFNNTYFYITDRSLSAGKERARHARSGIHSSNDTSIIIVSMYNVTILVIS